MSPAVLQPGYLVNSALAMIVPGSLTVTGCESTLSSAQSISEVILIKYLPAPKPEKVTVPRVVGLSSGKILPKDLSVVASNNS